MVVLLLLAIAWPSCNLMHNISLVTSRAELKHNCIYPRKFPSKERTYNTTYNSPAVPSALDRELAGWLTGPPPTQQIGQIDNENRIQFLKFISDHNGRSRSSSSRMTFRRTRTRYNSYIHCRTQFRPVMADYRRQCTFLSQRNCS